MNYDAINALIGKDWSYPDNDCWQVFRKASLNVFGVEIEEIEVPKKPSIKKNARLFDEYSKKQQWKRINSPEPGCAVMFRNARRLAVHIGIFISKGDVLHCSGSKDAPGKTQIQNIGYLELMYPKIEYYKYAPDNHS